MSSNDRDPPSEIAPLESLDPGAFVIRTIRNDPALQPSIKHKYIEAVTNYLDTGASLTDPIALAEYSLTAGSSTRSFLAAAVTRMAKQFEHAENTRRNLMTDVAHKLRTPLAVLDGNLRTMLDGVHVK